MMAIVLISRICGSQLQDLYDKIHAGFFIEFIFYYFCPWLGKTNINIMADKKQTKYFYCHRIVLYYYILYYFLAAKTQLNKS